MQTSEAPSRFRHPENYQVQNSLADVLCIQASGLHDMIDRLVVDYGLPAVRIAVGRWDYTDDNDRAGSGSDPDCFSNFVKKDFSDGSHEPGPTEQGG